MEVRTPSLSYSVAQVLRGQEPQAIGVAADGHVWFVLPVPPIAVNLTILALQTVVPDPLLHTHQSLICHRALCAPATLTVTGPTAAGDLRVFPGGTPLPLTSSINYAAGQTRANNAVLRLGPNEDLTVRCDQASGTVHLIIDVNGFYQ